MRMDGTYSCFTDEEMRLRKVKDFSQSYKDY